MEQLIRNIILGIIALTGLMLWSGCENELDAYYGVNETEVIPPNAEKNKVKTTEQYLAILYANMFQKALSANDLVELKAVVESVGDKELVHEIIISNFMNRSDVLLPSDSLMRADVDAFIDETYTRFMIRKPTEAERTYFRNYINANPNLTPELVYFAFALSNEYQFY